MKHKWHDVLIAIAEGKEVEFYCADEWITANIEDSITNPLTHYHFEWRIKKEPVIEVKYFYRDSINYDNFVYCEFTPPSKYLWELKITYQDGKAIKSELPL